MEHERMRFKTMTVAQLYTRLGRIAKEDKLRKFIAVAKEFGYSDLAAAGNRKLNKLNGIGQQPAWRNLPPAAAPVVSKRPDPKPPPKPLDLPRSDQPLKRLIEF